MCSRLEEHWRDLQTRWLTCGFARVWLIPAAVALFLILHMAAIGILQFFTRKPIFFVEPWFFAADYYQFFLGSQHLLRGGSLYDSYMFAVPPPFGLINVILVPLGFNAARMTMVAIILTACVYAYAHVVNWIRSERADQAILWLAGGLAALHSLPFYSLIARANLDACVVALMILGLIRLAGRPVLGGVALGLAAALKLYPMLLVIPLVIDRRWRTLAAMVSTLAACVVATPRLWRQYSTQFLGDRATEYCRLEIGRAHV